ncbi:MAG: arginine--tRNA ligase [Candidatus Shapirobacteria bacterium]|nr:arginine--tRNA ligase [Candidatus Shapirobacteria bacterium]MDD5481467.1 arginine--tRNA ligase [Candidatus Shapirobacteria bacterium]
MEIENILKGAILSALREMDLSDCDFDLESGDQSGIHGDYATNAALLAFSKDKKNTTVKNPLELARKIIKILEREASLQGVIAKMEAAPPGFVNFYLSEEFYWHFLLEVFKRGDDFGRQSVGQGKTIVIDYSSPNVAKPFGVGHLRSTVIGQALYNIFSFLGYRVIGDNHLGDWGTQFGVLLFQIDQNKLDADKLTIEDLEKLYVSFHKRLDKEPQLQDEARSRFRRLESGEPKLKKIWQKLVDLSLTEYQRVYQLLGVEIDLCLGESFYQDKMALVLADAHKKNLIVKSQGALVIPLKDSLVPAMLVKSDGATTYLLRDLATIRYRVEKYNPELIIYEVGADHKLHFSQVFESAQKLGYIDRKKLVHVAHGMIRGRFGKLSTRAGKSVYLEKILTEAIDRAKQLAAQAGIAKSLPEGEQKEVAKKVGIGAVKYNDLKQNPKTNIVFDWEKILSLEGNSGPYLQYTYARARRIIEKEKPDLLKTPNYQPKNDELSIIRLICYFEKTIRQSAKNFSPNLIANHLYQIAQSYNTFYGRHRVLVKDQETRIFRLLLTAAVAQTLKNGLALLGIEAPEKM